MAYYGDPAYFNNSYNEKSCDNALYGLDNPIYKVNTQQYIPSTGGPNQFLTYKDNGTGLYWADAPKSNTSYTLLEIIQDICSE